MESSSNITITEKAQNTSKFHQKPPQNHPAMPIISTTVATTHRVPAERLDGLVDGQFADVDALVGATRGEAGVALPVDVERRRRVERELLGAVARRRVPDDGRLTRHRGRGDVRLRAHGQRKKGMSKTQELSCRSLMDKRCNIENGLLLPIMLCLMLMSNVMSNVIMSNVMSNVMSNEYNYQT